jgi:hypothetical protein
MAATLSGAAQTTDDPPRHPATGDPPATTPVAGRYGPGLFRGRHGPPLLLPGHLQEQRLLCASAALLLQASRPRRQGLHDHCMPAHRLGSATRAARAHPRVLHGRIRGILCSMR